MMTPEPPYAAIEQAEEAYRLACEDTPAARGTDAAGSSVRHDLAQAVMLDCTLSVARELARVTGVELPSWAEGSPARQPGT
jgi:hypothetical protein